MYSHKEFLFVNTSGEALFCKTMLCALAEGFHRPVKQAKPRATTNKHESAFTCISHACGTLKNDHSCIKLLSQILIVQLNFCFTCYFHILQKHKFQMSVTLIMTT